MIWIKHECRDESFDGWIPVEVCGSILWELYDQGEFVIICPEAYLYNLLQDSGMPLKIIEMQDNVGNSVRF